MNANAKKVEKPRLKKQFEEEIVPALTKELGMKNNMQAPRLEKVVVNIGIGDASGEPKTFENAQNEIAVITGQTPVITRAKKSIAGFKIRQGQPVGLKVTLRDNMMYEFVDRFLSLAIPRMRDFRGLSRKSFDKFGNYSTGIQEQLIFPEIDYDKIDKLRGMDITFVTSANNSEQAEALLEKLGFPLKEKKK